MGIDPDIWESIMKNGTRNDKDREKLQREWKTKFGWLHASYETINYDADGEYLGNGNEYKIGQLEITLDQAEKILSLLTPRQLKALKN